MYEPLILIHSWTRWIVLTALIFLFFKSLYRANFKPKWNETDDNAIWIFNQVFSYQIVFGLTLWLGTSPFIKVALQHPTEIFSNSVLNFWVIRHPLTMIFAQGIFHMGKARAKRYAPEQKPKIFALTLGACLVTILSALPWSWLSYSRPFFRWY